METSLKPELSVYMDEYTRPDIIARYIADSAGLGIAHVLTNVYSPIYLKALKDLIQKRPSGHAFRVLEYGCGGGMNLLQLAQLIQGEGVRLDRGFGTDFSAPMIEAARSEAARRLPPGLNQKITFAVAGNECLIQDLSKGTSIHAKDLRGTFDFVVGVNTTRYGHRLGKENEAAKDLYDLLAPGGYSIMIDMNKQFPFFRSAVRDRLTRPKHEYAIPTLEEYLAPFEKAGFEILEKRNFCWIPHSAKRLLLALCKWSTPVLNTVCPRYAMRSLIIGRKPK